MEKIVCFLLLALYGASAAPAVAPVEVENNSTVISIHLVANDGQFPFMVSIQRRYETSTNRHKCGGALITLQHVLTAASCLYDTSPGYPMLINLEHFRVFAGNNGILNDNDPNRIRLISNYTMHPDFANNNNEHANDIAILTLESPFIANTRITPLSLPLPYARPNESTSTCTVAGWGQLQPGGNMYSNLKYATKSLLTQTECETQYPELFDTPPVTSSMVCAAATRDLTYGCAGDEGNPLVCNGGLVGIMFHSNRCGISMDPVLYTRVSNYTVWAQSVIGVNSSSSTFQPGFALVFILSVAQIITSKFKN